MSYHLHPASVSSKLAELVLSELGCEAGPADCLTEASLTSLMTAALRVEAETDNWGWAVRRENKA